MIGVITGDIIHSRNVDSTKYLLQLKQVLQVFGDNPGTWDIYRGDSFQLITGAQTALKAAIMIKASIKQVRELDVRLAIGLGAIEHLADKVTESNGPAFVFSGDCFDALKKNRLQIKSADPKYDETINVMLRLANLTMDVWTTVSAELVLTGLMFPEINQKAMAEKLGKSQSNISEGLSRAGYREVLDMLHYFEKSFSNI
jgi:hypothetical protein